jgi:methionine aminopeptidase
LEITVKTDDEVNLMRAACKLAKKALDFGGSLVKVSPLFLNSCQSDLSNSDLRLFKKK